ncbi:triple tyrosine motif-containing protein [Parapedobacter koreensis]|uniref:Y_Y_Y domain-containing protein n=1 Tax=Parapedobacter koreensis TaxID=332977 RepID=A0A1H7GK07_9SPHI|nr:triple tyrosine motif-containing protein [Parapedobacter koreensis]SEK36840.1 Y_Y_Y domain-containing protein [Parapedobacter koreensis]
MTNACIQRALLIVVFLTGPVYSAAQHRVAIPQIINYNNNQYKGGLQNWDIAQDSHGIMYFGNNEGLLTFNGRYWNNYPLPNATVVRSIAIDKNDRVYVGGQDEVGYFEADSTGSLQYHSLIDLIPNQERQFADVWDIVITDAGVFFRANTKILHYKDSRIRVDKTITEWQFLGEAGGKLYAQSMKQGIMYYESGFWKPLTNHPDLNGNVITAIMPYNQDTLLITTLKQGLFFLTDNMLIPKKTPFDELFSIDRIYCGLPVNNDWFVLGTTSAGVLIVDRQDRLVQQYVYGEGLQKNNVRDVFIDRNRNLWLALDDGIDFIGINSAVKYIHPNKANPISSYAVRLFDRHLYIGTSNGLYATPVDSNQEDISLSNADFSEVSHTEGQVWSLNEINGRLLMGHEDGAFEIINQSARKIYTIPGTWLYQPVSRVFPSQHLIAGTYLGLHHVTFDGNVFRNAGRVDGPYESLRFIHYDDHDRTIWASHPYRGVFKFNLSEDFSRVAQQKTYTHEDGLPSSLYNYVFLVKNKITVATNDGIYEYEGTTDRFIPSPLFYSQFKGVEIQYFKEDNDGNVWFVNHKKLGVVDFSRPTDSLPYTTTYFPELNGQVLGGFENIYILNEENIFIGANRGAIHLNYQRYKENISKPDILLNQINLINSGEQAQVLYGGHRIANMAAPTLHYRSNSLHFSFSTTLYDQQDNVEFSYLLEGFDKAWATWSNRSEKEYTNLPPGEYVFKVKSRNSNGNESDIDTYSFIISPPWYGNPISYTVYGVLIGLLILLLFKWQRKKLQRRHDHELYLSQLELDRSEKEVVRLQNEKLGAEIAFKNKELANMTMHLIQRGEVLTKIKETILAVVKRHDFSDSTINFRQLIRLIRTAERTEEDWEQFSVHFNHVNQGFFTNLKEQYPDLTPNELKLCAFLRMNLSSKEIAQLMNITIKAVEVSRYRLRKKIKLEPEQNLYEFLLQIPAGKG